MARLTTEQMFDNVSVAPKTAAGNDAPIDGDVTMTSSDPAVVAVEVLGPNLFRILSVAKGAAQIEATFDADMDGDEIRTLTASAAIEVVDAEAETAELVFGAPVLKDTAVVVSPGDVTAG